MKIHIVIPTYKRLLKLYRALYSIANQGHFNYKITVIADNNDTETFDDLKSRLDVPIFQCIINKKQEYVIGSWNRFFKEYINDDWDGVLWLVDDIEMQIDCLLELEKCFLEHFPDTDGVVGLTQTAPGHPEYTWKPYGQILIGRKFVERYKDVDYKVCCPDYIHFYQDEELYNYSKSLGKFVLCDKAIIAHYHPGFYPEELDKTHFIPRDPKLKHQDDFTYRLRKQKGLIWGKSWELVNE